MVSSTEHMTSDFASERLTTPGAKSNNAMNADLADLRQKIQGMDKVERNKFFHQVMQPFSSIVIQPTGNALDRSFKLNTPVFTLRDMPVKEQYKKGMRKINELYHPELVNKRNKPE